MDRATTLPPLTDAELVDAARRLERGAFEEIYTRHAPRVRRLLVRILGACNDVDDVLQTAFLRAYKNLAGLREPRALGAWLCAVGVGAARHHIRSRQRRSWLWFKAPEDIPEPWVGPVDAVARDAVAATYRVLHTLPVDLRLAFTLRHLDGMQLDEAAAVLGVSLATFKRRLARADALFFAGAGGEGALASFVAPVGGAV